MRRMAFFFSIRRTSLFDTNQRLLRNWLSSPLRITFFLKRLKSCSCDSFGRKVTDVMKNHLLAAVKSRPGPRQQSDAHRAPAVIELRREQAKFTLGGKDCQFTFAVSSS